MVYDRDTLQDDPAETYGVVQDVSDDKVWRSTQPAERQEVDVDASTGGPEEEYDSCQDLDIDDIEGASCAGKTVDEHLAELQRVMRECQDGGDEQLQITCAEPLEQLQAQCDDIREDVLSMAKVRQELEQDLRQNVCSLRERVESQYRDKASLTERLLEVKDKLVTKHEDMATQEKEMRSEVDAERTCKEHLHTEWSARLKALHGELADLQRQIQDDWESQVALIGEIDAETDSQSQLHFELHEERERSWRHNREIIQSIAKAGNLPALSALPHLAGEGPGAQIGNLQSQSARNLETVTASPQWRVNENYDRHNDDLRNQLDSERLGSQDLQDELEEERRELQLHELDQVNNITELRRQLLEIEKSSILLNKRLLELKSQPASVLRSQSRQSISTAGESVAAREPSVLGEETNEVCRVAEDLHDCIGRIEEKQSELARLAGLLDRGHAEERSQNAADGPSSVQANVLRSEAERDAKLQEKADAEKEKQDVLNRRKQYEDEIRQKAKIEALRKEVKDKKVSLETLRTQNAVLQQNLQAQQQCCFGSKPLPIPRPKVPPTPTRGRGKGGKGKGKGRDEITIEQADDPTLGPPPLPPPLEPIEDNQSLALSEHPSERVHDRSTQEESSPSNVLRRSRQWQVGQAMFVCRVGEESWLSGSTEIPVELRLPDDQSDDWSRPAQSIAEAVEFLKAQPPSETLEDCYLVRDASTKTWYCIWRNGAQGIAVERIGKHVRPQAVSDPALAAPAQESHRREPSRPGRPGQQSQQAPQEPSKARRPSGERRAGATRAAPVHVDTDYF